MVIKNVLLLCALAFVAQAEFQTKLAVDPVPTKSLRLASEYRKNSLEDISPDGSLLLFYETNQPVRSYTISLANGRGRAKQKEDNSDVLRVVERNSGRELGRISVGFYPSEVQFISGSRRVFYKEPKVVDGNLEWRIKIWDLTNSEARECSGANVEAQSFLVSDEQHVLKIMRFAGEGEHLSNLVVPACTQTEDGPTKLSQRIQGSISFSPARKELAYVSGKQIVVRNTETLNVTKEIGPGTDVYLGPDAIYTPDGKFLVVLVTNTIFDKPETKRILYFYETTNYQLVRQLDVTRWRPPVPNDEVSNQSNVLGTAVAFSPDSRTIAIASTNDQSRTQQAQIALYDLETGNEISRAYHPAVKENRRDPFVSRIGRLAFTPDGKYLFSSTHDTLVWEVAGH